MLLRVEGDTVLAIGQQSHAWISGQLARAWGNERFPVPEPWEEVCLAAEQHDVGFAEWDLAPSFNAETGLPHSFIEMPVPDHLGLWSTAPRRLLPQSRYAALVVSMHGSRLYRRRDLDQLEPQQADAVREYLRDQQGFQTQLIASLAHDPLSRPWVQAPALDRNSQMVWIWDFLSLAVCLEWAPRTAREVPTAGGVVDIELAPGPRARTVRLDPWPFGDAPLAVRCDARLLERRYASESEFRADFARAPWQRVEFEFLAG